MKNEEEVETSTKGVQEDEVKNDMNLNNSWWFFERAPTISLFLMNNRCKSVILFLLFYVWSFPLKTAAVKMLLNFDIVIVLLLLL